MFLLYLGAPSPSLASSRLCTCYNARSWLRKPFVGHTSPMKQFLHHTQRLCEQAKISSYNLCENCSCYYAKILMLHVVLMLLLHIIIILSIMHIGMSHVSILHRQSDNLAGDCRYSHWNREKWLKDSVGISWNIPINWDGELILGR